MLRTREKLGLPISSEYAYKAMFAADILLRKGSYTQAIDFYKELEGHIDIGKRKAIIEAEGDIYLIKKAGTEAGLLFKPPISWWRLRIYKILGAYD